MAHRRQRVLAVRIVVWVGLLVALIGVGVWMTAMPGSNPESPLPALAARFAERPQPRTLRFIAFVNEEPPFYRTPDMGSYTYARECSAREERITAMMSMDGVGWSDHWSFWQHGYPAFLVTDTLPFRDPDYHRASDTAERLDYVRMARLTEGLEAVVIALAE